MLTNIASGWQITGTSVFLHDSMPSRLDYLIECDSNWETRVARVNGWVGSNGVAVEISADAARRWCLNHTVCDRVTGCIDVDLNFSPVTNTLPIRRLNLQAGDEANVRAAWLRFPTFTLELLEQVYRRLDATTYRYESAGGSFVRDLRVNEAGLVIHYPDFFEAEG